MHRQMEPKSLTKWDEGHMMHAGSIEPQEGLANGNIGNDRAHTQQTDVLDRTSIKRMHRKRKKIV